MTYNHWSSRFPAFLFAWSSGEFEAESVKKQTIYLMEFYVSPKLMKYYEQLLGSEADGVLSENQGFI